MKELVLLQDARDEGRDEAKNDAIEKLALHFIAENKELTMEEARKMAKAILD